MFQSARLKLTAWYLTLIMAISILFSAVIYRGITDEVDRSLRVQQVRIYRLEHPGAFIIQPEMIGTTDTEIFDSAHNRIRLILILINTGIFLIAGGAGYFLAGRTLKPIQEMVDEQNRFITDASHELRTPLTALRAEIEVNLRDANLSIEEAKQLLASNLEEVQNLQTLSDNLLQLAQHQKPHVVSLSQSVLLEDVLQEAIHKVQSYLQNKQITLVQKKINKYEIKGEKQSLVQLFIILLENAIKYSPEKTTVTIAAKAVDHTLVITITDQGLGIDKKDIPHIFDRFYRADTSRTKKDISGYGLGLSIAKKIVDMHQGTISVKSEKNKGTTFSVQLQKA